MSPARFSRVLALSLGIVMAISVFRTAVGDVLPARSFTNLRHVEISATEIAATPFITVEGINRSGRTAELFIDVRPYAAAPFEERASFERMVNPGPFSLVISLARLRDNAGRPMHLDPARHTRVRAVAFADSSEAAGLIVDTLALAVHKVTHSAVLALDFGGPEDATMPGFAAVGPDSPDLTCQKRCDVVSRPDSDWLIGDGIQGITNFRQAVPNGRYTLHLWTASPGEWEYVPYHREQRIRVNGRTIHHTLRSREDWVFEHYARAPRPAESGDDGWTAYGRAQGGLHTADIEVSDGVLDIALAGDRASAGHLSGLLLVHATDSDSFAAVQAARARQFNSRWPVVTEGQPLPGAMPPPASGTLRIDAPPYPLTASAPLHMTAAVFVPPGHPQAALSLDGLDDGVVGSIWIGRPTLIRKPSHLTWETRMFRALAPGDPIPAGWSELRLRLTRDHSRDTHAPRASFTLGLRLILRAGLETSISVPVLQSDVALPPGPAVGAYLEDWPPATWFAGAEVSVLPCLVRTLEDMGLDAIAPPASRTGVETADADILADMATRFPRGTLAYAHVKRAEQTKGPIDGLARIASINHRIATQGRTVLWSIADEPTHWQHERIRGLAASLRGLDPTIQVAGHLNSDSAMDLADVLDVSIVNHGFGLTARRLHPLRGEGRAVWFYNLPDPKIAAGLLAWAHRADGYLQWHAMMPTAAPWDPTDGREGDFYLVYPDERICSDHPTLDRKLLDMAAGQTDGRWLAFLAQEAPPGSTLAASVEEIRRGIAEAWNGGPDSAAALSRISSLVRAFVAESQSQPEPHSQSGNPSRNAITNGSEATAMGER